MSEELAQTDAERISELEAHLMADEHTIAGLETQSAQDQASISVLEAQAVIDHEIIAAIAEQGVQDRDQISNLEAALVSARRIGAAMGIIMTSQKVTEEQAFAVLKGQSQHSHRKLRDVAEDVLFTGVVGNERAAASDVVLPTSYPTV